jgi:group I intron endonuclease
MGVIYKITSPKNRIYIGKATDFRTRINGHKCASKKEKLNTILYNSIRKYGWDAHLVEIIETVEKELLNEREIFWIEYFKSYSYFGEGGMNMTIGGDGNKGSWLHRLDLREKQSKLFSGEGNPFFGRKHTEESKRMAGEKISKINKSRGTTIPKWGAEKGRLKCIKAVKCFGVNGNLVGTFCSLVEAAKSLSLNRANISQSLKTNSWVSGKYYFRYESECPENKIAIGKINVPTVKRPVYYIIGEKIKEYDSSLEASKELNVPKTSINRAALYNNGKPLRSGHIFIYKDLYEAKIAS